MARYVRFKNGEDRYVWDQEKNILYAETFLGDNEYQVAKINVQQLSKFAPETEDDGEFDNFPGKIVLELPNMTLEQREFIKRSKEEMKQPLEEGLKDHELKRFFDKTAEPIGSDGKGGLNIKK